jgi:hypothetical protein
VKATLEDAWKVTRVFEGFAEGPGKVVDLGDNLLATDAHSTS